MNSEYASFLHRGIVSSTPTPEKTSIQQPAEQATVNGHTYRSNTDQNNFISRLFKGLTSFTSAVESREPKARLLSFQTIKDVVNRSIQTIDQGLVALYQQANKAVSVAIKFFSPQPENEYQAMPLNKGEYQKMPLNEAEYQGAIRDSDTETQESVAETGLHQTDLPEIKKKLGSGAGKEIFTLKQHDHALNQKLSEEIGDLSKETQVTTLDTESFSKIMHQNNAKILASYQNRMAQGKSISQGQELIAKELLLPPNKGRSYTKWYAAQSPERQEAVSQYINSHMNKTRLILGHAKEGQSDKSFIEEEVKPLMVLRERLKAVGEVLKPVVGATLATRVDKLANLSLITLTQENETPSLNNHTWRPTVGSPRQAATLEKIAKWSEHLVLSTAVEEKATRKIGIVSHLYGRGNAKEATLTQREKIEGLITAAKGLAALHAMNLAHGDMAARNLLGKDYIQDGKKHFALHLNDFGRMREVDKTGSCPLKDATTPLRWTAPENFGNPASVSLKGDVFAMGMTMFEIFLGPDFSQVFNDRPPSHALGVVGSSKIPGEEVNSYISKKWEDFKSRNNNPIPPEIEELILKCCSNNPANRPTVEQVVQALEKANVPIPSN